MAEKDHNEKVERPQDLAPEDEVKGGRVTPRDGSPGAGADKDGVIVTDGGRDKDGVIVTD